MLASPSHIPVMLREVLEKLSPNGGVFIDGTFGAGGYTKAILDNDKNNIVIAIDRDDIAIKKAKAMQKEYKERLIIIRGCFGDMHGLVGDKYLNKIDGIVLDIGVSSMQIDDKGRGFSFQKDGPLDMRMDKSQTLSAYNIVNEYSEEEIADILYKYGEERRSRRIARKIIEARKKSSITTTGELAHLIEKALPASKKDKIHPATRSFQAIRIFVNDELGELKRALVGAEKLLNTGGRLVVVTFHSLEERIVKRFFREKAGLTPRGSRHSIEANIPILSDSQKQPNVSFKLLDKKAIKATDEEIEANPRARSARLRWGVKNMV